MFPRQSIDEQYDLNNADSLVQLAMWEVDPELSCDNYDNFVLIASNNGNITAQVDTHLNNIQYLTANATYHIQLDGGFAGVMTAGTIEIIECATNPDFICLADTLELDGSPVDFDLSTAGTEASEVSGVWYEDDPADNTLWYKVVAPSTGCIDVKVSSINDTDTQLALWSTSAATSCNDFENFELLASHEDFFVMETYNAHLINVAGLNPGETYYVQLDGYDSNNAIGTIEATTCSGELAPDNDGVCSPQAIIVDGAPVSYNNTYATADYDEVQGANWTAGYNGTDAGHLPDFDAAQNSLWYTFKAPLNGCVSVIANVSQKSIDEQYDLNNADSLVQLAMWEVDPELSCDNYDNFVLIASNNGNITAQVDTHLNNIQYLTANATYHIQLDGGFAGVMTAGTIEIIECATNPDFICLADTLELDGSPVDFDLSTAGTEASEVSGVWYEDDPADNTLWYKVVAPSTGCIDVKVSSIYDADTQLALWSTSAATSCNDFENFELLASHEDFFVMVTGYAHLINVAGLNPGETYYVQLDGYESDNASGTIEATTCSGELAPDNDGVCSPQAIIVDGAPVSYNNTYATADYDEVQGANWTAGYNGMTDFPDFDAAQNSLWYTFKAPLNGCVSVIANVSQQSIDEQYDLNDADSLVQLAMWEVDRS